MQNPQVQARQQAERRNIARIADVRRGRLVPLLLILLLTTVFVGGGTDLWAQRADKKAKKPAAAAPQRESGVNDSTVQESLKKVEDQLKKGEIEGSLPTLVRINDYAEDVLKTVKLFRSNYEKVVNDASVSQTDKEDILIKLGRMNQLTPKYTAIRESSSYDLGWVYAKKGDTERARKYLFKVFETAPFSTRPDSLWMKSKRLLLAVYGLEGEF